MKIREIMTSEVEVVHPDDTLQTAARKMRDRDIGFLPVMDGGELIGVLTDRDLVLRAMADGTKLKTMVGRDIVTSPGIYCFDDQDVNDAAHLMQEHQIRRLVILSRHDGSVLGVISLGDLAVNSTPDASGEVLQSVSEEFVKTH